MMLHSLLAKLRWLQKWLPGQIRTKIIIAMRLSAVATAMAALAGQEPHMAGLVRQEVLGLYKDKEK